MLADLRHMLRSWRFCTPSKAPICLMLVSALVSLYCSQLLNEISVPGLPGKPSIVDWKWLQRTRVRLQEALRESKQAWPIPPKWKPVVNFDSFVAVPNATLPLTGYVNESLTREAKDLWLFCAGQWEQCACYGQIRWGSEHHWQIIPPPSAQTANRVKCKVGKEAGFPEMLDMNPGDDTKHCECQVNTASSFFLYLNFLAIPREERKKISALEASSCWIFMADNSTGGVHLWRGMEGICNPNWTDISAGQKPLPYKKITAALKSYVNPVFADTYNRLYDVGWPRRAFVSFFTGTLEGSQTQAVELLIEAVHRFSVYPIILFHAGMATPMHWSPRVYPRLILLSISELPMSLGHSTTLLLAAVISRVQTGILVPFNALVFPGVDRLFAAAEREITEQYPYPIMPVHFLNRQPADGGSFWTHFCSKSLCPRQTMRWSQLGLFWTVHALPFLAQTLRSVFRDESFSADAPFEPIRIKRVQDVESLINIALWKVGAYKQPAVFDWKPHFVLLFFAVCRTMSISGHSDNHKGTAVLSMVVLYVVIMRTLNHTLTFDYSRGRLASC